MNFKIPKVLIRLVDWLNVDVFDPVRRIDIALALGGIGCTIYYGYLYGWLGALQGAIAYVVMMLTGFFLREAHG